MCTSFSLRGRGHCSPTSLLSQYIEQCFPSPMHTDGTSSHCHKGRVLAVPQAHHLLYCNKKAVQHRLVLPSFNCTYFPNLNVLIYKSLTNILPLKSAKQSIQRLHTILYTATQHFIETEYLIFMKSSTYF